MRAAIPSSPAALLLILLCASPTLGADLVVTTHDESTASGTTCTLRQALAAANYDTGVGSCGTGSGADLILVPPGTHLLSTGDPGEDLGIQGDLDILEEVEIVGDRDPFDPPVVIDAAALGDRIFDIRPGVAAVTLRALILQGGRAPGNEDGGGIRARFDGHLEMVSVVVRDNRAEGGSGGGLWAWHQAGGGVALTMQSCVVENNHSAWGGGGVLFAHDADGILSAGVWITSTIFEGNTAGVVVDGVGADGGGLSVGGDWPTLWVTSSTFRENEAAGSGGAVRYSSDFGDPSFENIQFFDNVAHDGSGGALFLFSPFSSVTGSRFEGNLASRGGAVGGFGPEHSGPHLIVDSVLVGNTATVSDGGAVFSNGTLEVYESRLEGNVAAGDGGAIAVGRFVGGSSMSARIEDSHLLGNTAGVTGGAVHVRDLGDGVFRLFASTLEANGAQFAGGLAIDHPGQSHLIRSTITGNLAFFDGGGLVLGSAAGAATLHRSTVTANAAGSEGASSVGGGLLIDSGATLEAANSIVAGNTATDGSPDCFGPVNSQGYLLVGDATGCAIVGEPIGVQTGTAAAPLDAGLEPLAWYGPHAPSHGLAESSPALDAGPPAGSPVGFPCGFDQHESPALDGDGDGVAVCDLGSTEEPLDLFLDGFESGDTSAWSAPA